MLASKPPATTPCLCTGQGTESATSILVASKISPEALGRKAKAVMVDARDIALMIECLRPALWTPPAVERCQLQALVRHRLDLFSQVTAMATGLKPHRAPL